MVLTWQSWNWTLCWSCLQNHWCTLKIQICAYVWRLISLHLCHNLESQCMNYNLLAGSKLDCAEWPGSQNQAAIAIASSAMHNRKIRNHRIVQLYSIGQNSWIKRKSFDYSPGTLTRPHENSQRVLTSTCWHSQAVQQHLDPRRNGFGHLPRLSGRQVGATAKLVSDLMSLKCRFVCTQITRILGHFLLWKRKQEKRSDQNLYQSSKLFVQDMQFIGLSYCCIRDTSCFQKAFIIYTLFSGM